MKFILRGKQMSVSDSAPRHLVEDDLFHWNGDNFDSLEEKSQGTTSVRGIHPLGTPRFVYRNDFLHCLGIQYLLRFQSGAKSGGLTRWHYYPERAAWLDSSLWNVEGWQIFLCFYAIVKLKIFWVFFGTVDPTKRAIFEMSLFFYFTCFTIL